MSNKLRIPLIIGFSKTALWKVRVRIKLFCAQFQARSIYSRTESNIVLCTALLLTINFTHRLRADQIALVSQTLHPILYNNVLKTYRTKGQAWLEALPSYVHQLTAKWQLRNCIPFNNLTYNYVFRAYSDLYNTDVVCKIGPDKKTLKREYQALKFYKGRASVKIYGFDKKLNAFLMQSLIPGEIMREQMRLDDPRVIKIVSKITKRLHSVPVTKNELSYFPHIKNIVLFLWDQNAKRCIPPTMLKRAQHLAAHLITTAEREVLLHGDLHCNNIIHYKHLRWKALDPKGYIGEPAYDIAVFMRSRWVEPLLEYKNPSKLISSRLDGFAHELGIERWRLWAWSFVYAVLSISWVCKHTSMSSAQERLKLAQIIESVEVT